MTTLTEGLSNGVASSLSEMKNSLEKISTSTANMETFLASNAETLTEEGRAERIRDAEQKKQTGFLAGIFADSKEDKKDKGFFGRHWKKLLVAALVVFGLMKMPLEYFAKAKNFIDEVIEKFKDNPVTIASAVVSALIAGGWIAAKVTYPLRHPIKATKIVSTKIREHFSQRRARVPKVLTPKNIKASSLRVTPGERTDLRTAQRTPTPLGRGMVGTPHPDRSTLNRGIHPNIDHTKTFLGEKRTGASPGGSFAHRDLTANRVKPTRPPKPVSWMEKLRSSTDNAVKTTDKLMKRFFKHPTVQSWKLGGKAGLKRIITAIIPFFMLKELLRRAHDPEGTGTKSFEDALDHAVAVGIQAAMYNPFIDLDPRGGTGTIPHKDAYGMVQKGKSMFTIPKGLGTPIDKSKLNPEQPLNTLGKAKLDTIISKQKGKGGDIHTDTIKQAMDLKRHENLRLSVYPDSVGVPTIGYGFNLTKPDANKKLKAVGISKSAQHFIDNKGQLTQAQAVRLLALDKATALTDAISFVGSDGWARLDDRAKAVVKNMAFNLGLTRLSGFSNFRDALRAEDYSTAADEMMYNTDEFGNKTKTKWARQVKGRADELTSIMARIPNQTGAFLNSPTGGAGNINAGPPVVITNNTTTVAPESQNVMVGGGSTATDATNWPGPIGWAWRKWNN